MKSLGQFISLTRSKPCTIRGEEIEIDGVPVTGRERSTLMAEFDAWTPPPKPEEPDLHAELEALRARVAILERPVR